METNPLEPLAGSVITPILTGLRAGADAVVGLDPEGVGTAELGAGLRELHREIERLRGAATRWTGSFERRGGHRAGGHRDVQSFLQTELHQSPTDARRQTEAARDLAVLPATAEALATGEITFDQAATIGRTTHELGGVLGASGSGAADSADRDPSSATTGPDRIAAAEATLLAEARHADGGQVRRAGRELVRRADRDAGRADAAHAHRQRTLTLIDDHRGSTFIEGRVTNTVGAKLRTILEPHTRPSGRNDQRTPGQRNADALEAILDRTAAAQTPRGLSRTAQPGLPGTAERASTPGASREPGDRLGGVLAVATLATIAGASDDPAHLRNGQPIPPEVVRGLVCEAGLSLLITDTTGLPLWLGRAERFASDAQRAALLVRDGGCRFPECTMPADRTIVHHVDFDPTSHDPGPTDIDRMASICAVDHNLVHHAGWTLHLDADATVTVTSPDGTVVLTETAAQARIRHTGTDLLPGTDLPAAHLPASPAEPTSSWVNEHGTHPARSPDLGQIHGEVAGETRGRYLAGSDPPASGRLREQRPRQRRRPSADPVRQVG